MCVSSLQTTLHASTQCTMQVTTQKVLTNSINRPSAFKSLHKNMDYFLLAHRSLRNETALCLSLCSSGMHFVTQWWETESPPKLHNEAIAAWS